MEIREITTLSDETFHQLAQLMQELSSSYSPDRAALEAVVMQDNSHLYGLYIEAELVGSYTLAYYHTPTGSKACLEDVVVHSDFRGRGLGRELITDAISRLRESGTRQVLLTSKPARQAANALYQAMGFTRKETNVYVMKF